MICVKCGREFVGTSSGCNRCWNCEYGTNLSSTERTMDDRYTIEDIKRWLERVEGSWPGNCEMLVDDAEWGIATILTELAVAEADEQEQGR